MSSASKTHAAPPSGDSFAITVLIPVRNYGYFLREALDSALSQIEPSDAVLVVDDGSTDDTPRIVQEYRDYVRAMQTGGIGVYAVRQRALETINTPWFFNLDADNRLRPRALARLREAALRHSDCPDAAFFYPSIHRVGQGSNKRIAAEPYDLSGLIIRNRLDMNALIRTEAARAVGFDPDLRAQGDYDFFLRAIKQGYRGVPVPEAVVYYRVHPDSISQTMRRTAQHTSVWRRLMRKHADLYTPADRAKSRLELRNRICLSLIAARNPHAGPGVRLRQLSRFFLYGARHAEFQRQLAYTWSPARYFQACVSPCDLFYLFPHQYWLAEALDLYEGGETSVAVDDMLGYAHAGAWGWKTDHNLRYHPLIQSDVQQADIASLTAEIQKLAWQARRAACIIAATAEWGVAAAIAMQRGRWRRPLVMAWRSNSSTSALLEDARYRRCIVEADRVLTWNRADFDQLAAAGCPASALRLLPPAVDGTFWSAEADARTFAAYDALTIGEANWVDLPRLCALARRAPSRRFAVHLLGAESAAGVPMPENLRVFGSIPYTTMRARMQAARAIVLPIHANKMGCAQPWLLRALSMRKPVLVMGCAGEDIREWGACEAFEWIPSADEAACARRLDAILASPRPKQGTSSFLQGAASDMEYPFAPLFSLLPIPPRGGAPTVVKGYCSPAGRPQTSDLNKNKESAPC